MKAPTRKISFEALFARLVRKLRYGVTVWRLEDRKDPRSFRLIAVNPAACRITGLALHRKIGKTIRQVLPAVLRTRRPLEYRDVILSGHPRDLAEIEWTRGRLRGRIFATSGYPLPGDCIALVFEEVTEKKRAAEELRKSQRRMREVLDNLNAFVALLTPSGRVIERNRTVLDAFDEKLAESVGRPFAELGPWKWSPAVQKQVRAAIRRAAGGERVRYDVRHSYPDGGFRDVDVSMVPVGGTRGRIRNIIVSGVDITERKRAEEETRRVQQLLRSILDGIPLPVGVLTPKGILLEGNACALRSFGRKGMSYTGSPFWKVPVWNQSRALEAKARDAIRRAARGEDVRFDVRCTGRDGLPMTLDFSLVPLRDPDGRISSLIASAVDISERVRAEDDREKSHGYLRRIVDGLPFFLALLDSSGRLRVRNRYSPSTFPTSRAAVQGKPLWAVAPWSASPAIRKLTRSMVRDVAKRGKARTGEVEIALEGGRKVSVEWFLAPIRDARGKITDLVASGRDVTERRRGEEERARLFAEVEQGREHLRLLSRRLVEIQEAERRGIARELHDEIGQILTSLRMVLEGGGGGGRHREVRALLNDLTGRVRDLSMNLRPAMLDDLGLVPALLWHLERFSAQTGVRVHFRHRGADRRFTTEVETAAFRIVQEALTNVARHAGTKDARVFLRVDGDRLTLRVEDEGRGFDRTVVPPRGSSGLLGIQERVRLLGGRLTLESTRGAGTIVSAEIPVRTGGRTP